MKSELHGTPLRSSDYPMLLFSDAFAPSLGDTPLLALDQEEESNRAVLVSTDVIRKYHRIIFELEQQILRYKVLVRHLTQRRDSGEEFAAEPSTPLNTASVNVVNSILRARVSEQSILRAYDEEEL